MRVISLSKLLILIASLVLGAGLSACDPDGPLGAAAPVTANARAPGIPVAVLALDGAPSEITSKLAGELSGAARQREVTIVGAGGKPQFQITGALSAYPASGGTAIAWTFDIFDASKRRAQRISGVETVKGSPADPWSALDQPTLQRIAGRSMEDIATFLSANAPASKTAQRGSERVRAEAAD